MFNIENYEVPENGDVQLNFRRRKIVAVSNRDYDAVKFDENLTKTFLWYN